jgi:DNA-directed RNA polymerase subunit RPC12/RpoP
MILVCLQCGSDMKEITSDLYRCTECEWEAEQLTIEQPVKRSDPMNWKAATREELYTILQENRAHPLDKQEAQQEILRRCRPKWRRVQYKIKEK